MTIRCTFIFQGSATQLSALYMDKDTMAVNRLRFDILNDTMEILNLEVSAFEDDSHGIKFSAFYIR